MELIGQGCLEKHLDSQIPQAACQFRSRGFKKKRLTVKGSGCVPSGHAPRPPRWLPISGVADAASIRFGAPHAPTKAGRRCKAIPSRSRAAGASRAARVPAAIECCRSVADTVSAQSNRGGFKRCRPPRFGVHVRGARGSIGSVRQRSNDARPPADGRLFAALGVPDPFPSPTNGRLAVLRRRCGAEPTARQPFRD
jgi:hypothetical protein